MHPGCRRGHHDRRDPRADHRDRRQDHHGRRRDHHDHGYHRRDHRGHGCRPFPAGCCSVAASSRGWGAAFPAPHRTTAGRHRREHRRRRDLRADAECPDAERLRDDRAATFPCPGTTRTGCCPDAGRPIAAGQSRSANRRWTQDADPDADRRAVAYHHRGCHDAARVDPAVDHGRQAGTHPDAGRRGGVPDAGPESDAAVRAPAYRRSVRQRTAYRQTVRRATDDPRARYPAPAGSTAPRSTACRWTGWIRRSPGRDAALTAWPEPWPGVRIRRAPRRVPPVPWTGWSRWWSPPLRPAGPARSAQPSWRSCDRPS